MGVIDGVLLFSSDMICRRRMEPLVDAGGLDDGVGAAVFGRISITLSPISDLGTGALTNGGRLGGGNVARRFLNRENASAGWTDLFVPKWS